jgi:hypothetical protein
MSLAGHTAEIVSVCFSNSGDLVATGSFDHDSRLWDVRTGQCVHVLSGHRGEVSSTVFNYSGGCGCVQVVRRHHGMWAIVALQNMSSTSVGAAVIIEPAACTRDIASACRMGFFSGMHPALMQCCVTTRHCICLCMSCRQHGPERVHRHISSAVGGAQRALPVCQDWPHR